MDLQEARRLIEKYGYGRKKEEPEVAKTAVSGTAVGEAIGLQYPITLLLYFCRSATVVLWPRLTLGLEFSL